MGRLMGEVTPGRHDGSPRPTRSGVHRFTLADEHDLLLQQVAVRTEELLSAAEKGGWPGKELTALLGYLRSEVLRQVVDEELLLLAHHDVQAQAAGLIRDHVRLRAGVETLAEAAVNADRFSASEVSGIAANLFAQLERHCSAEETLLAVSSEAQDLPATSLSTKRPHEWYPLTEGSVVDVDALPADQMVEALVDRLLRMRAGEQVELRSDRDLDPVWRRMRWYDPGGYRLVHDLEGPPQWRVRFTRRPAR